MLSNLDWIAVGAGCGPGAAAVRAVEIGVFWAVAFRAAAFDIEVAVAG